MKFLDFLNEAYADYKKEITEDEAIALIKKHCKNMDINEPLYRGTLGSGKFLSLHGEQRTRKSINTSNHYTLIIDEQLKKIKNAPLRSTSLMCATRDNIAGIYGKVYAIFPYDDVVIGRCDSYDIWNVGVSIGDQSGTMVNFNNYLNKFSKSPETYNQIVSDFAKILEDDSLDADPAEIKFKNDLRKEYLSLKIMPFSKADKKDIVDKVLAKAYDPETVCKFKFGTIDQLDLTGNHEVWFGGKCVAIKLDVYENMLKDGKFE